MEKFYRKIVDHPKLIIAIFAVLFVLCAIAKQFVSVDYDMNDYLPPDSASTVALDKMNEEFDGGIPNARVMIQDVSIAEALDYKEQLEAVDGVTDVTWLDDAVSITVPLETQDQDLVENYYKDGNALYSITIEEEKRIDAVADIREIIGEDNPMTGSVPFLYATFYYRTKNDGSEQINRKIAYSPLNYNHRTKYITDGA